MRWPIFLAMTLLAGVAEGDEMGDTWYEADATARGLSQLTAAEFAKFTGTSLLDVRPVVVPGKDNVVGDNDYFMWPIATKVDDTLLVLYQRTPSHWGPDLVKRDKNTGIRMVVTTTDGGKTWSEPVDVRQAGAWKNSPFKGFGGGLGVHDGVVYLAINQGVYLSKDKGQTWELVPEPADWGEVPERLWAPGMRITFDAVHGLTIWTTTGFAAKRKETEDYGDRLCAVYSPDFGKTWRYQEQEVPKGIGLSEVTPVQFDGKVAFFLRNGLHNTCYAQGYSATGWFPFRFAITNVGPVQTVDTPDIAYNPTTGRLRAAVSHRRGRGPGPKGKMKVNLYSISPGAMAKGESDWRYEGTLVEYHSRFGVSDGFNPVGSVVDTAAGVQYIHVWGGDGTGKAAIYQYTVSLDTPAVSKYLHGFSGK